MPAYFRFRSIDELRDEITAQGREIILRDDLAPLLAPLRIGQLTVSNRMLVHPMEGCDGNADGTPGPLTFRRWRRFAEGGAGVLWGEATAVVPEGRANSRQLLISRATLPELRRLLDETRAARRARFGAADSLVVGLQLTHSGRWSHAAPMIAQRSQTLDRVRGAGAAVVSDAQLEELEERFEDAAVMAADAGFDFVDIKQCHTYLLNELLASRGREGRYGGDFSARTRFVRNVFARVRSRVGENLALATRINVFDGVPYAKSEDGSGGPAPHATPYRAGWGVDEANPLQPDLSEPLRLIGELRPLGMAMLNVSMGSPYFNPHIGRPFERAPVDGYTPPEHPLAGVERHFALTAAVQRAYPDLPVAGTGYSWLRHYALNAGAANAAAGAVTMVGLGRGALAYPDFASDAMTNGAMERDKACIGVSYCTALMRAKHNDEGQYPTGCVPRDRMYAEQLKLANASEGWR